MTHLGERVVDLVDGQLSPADAERASVHLASCRPCRDQVEAERLTKARLAALGSPEPSPDFLGRLLAIAPDGAVAAAASDALSPVAVPAAPVSSVPGSSAGLPPAGLPPAAVAARTRTVAVGGTLGGSPAASSPAGRRPGRSVRPGGVPAAAAVATRPGRTGGARPATGPRVGRRVGRGRLAAAVIGALGTMGAGVAALAVAAPAAPATVVQPVDTFVVQSISTTVRLPILDIPGGWQLLRRGADGSHEGSRATR